MKVDRAEVVICYSDIKHLTVVKLDQLDLSAYFAVFNARVRHFYEKVGHIEDKPSKLAIQQAAETLQIKSYQSLLLLATLITILIYFLYF